METPPPDSSLGLGRDISAVPLPTGIARKIGDFLRSQLSGSIVINIQAGRVVGAKIEENVKA